MTPPRGTAMAGALRTALRVALLPLLLLVGGCQEEIEPLHVGSKDFTENMILAEMMAAMVEQERVPVQRSIPYGNTFVTFEALKQGRIHLIPEYNGTGLIYLGQPPTSDGDAAMERLRPLFADLGLTWRDRFGFSNDYVLTMRPERAQALGVRTIGDLARLPEVRFAVDEDFTKRPLDGLGALVRRYGLRQGTTVTHKIAEAGAKDRIIQALLQDDADVAELFRTDPQIEEYGLVVLEDDLRFFPVYEPAPLARADALQRFPAVAAALARLDGKITSEAMRRMNAEVDLNGQTARSVALGFLASQGLLQVADAAAAPGEALAVAIDAADSLSGPAGQALRAARAAFPKRAIAVREAPQPMAEVTSGRARLGVVSAEAFFAVEGDRAVPVGGAEALGVVGYKLAHVVTRRNGPATFEDVRRLGVGQSDSASDRTARMVLAAIGGADEVSVVSGGADDLGVQFDALIKGLVDALFVMAPDGDPTILTLMESGNFRLLPLAAWTSGNAALRFSFLRPAQIRAGTYAGQVEPVETVSAQMVLVGPSSVREAIGAQGPGTTGTAPTQPLSPGTIKQLNAALSSDELTDPTLPIPPALSPELAAPPQRLEADVWGAIVNLVVLLLMGYLFYLLVAAPRREPSPPVSKPVRPA
jgi:glycine betaine/choline ABC-type transport system substrate-binding protein